MRKHILVISQYFYPEQFRINDLTSEWIKRGYKVTVITGIPNYPKGKFFKGYGIFKNRHENYNGVDIIRIPIISRGKTSIGMVLNYFSFVISGFIWKCFTNIKADYVFIFEVSPMTQALPGVWYAKKRKIPCYIYVQDLWPENVVIAAGIKNKKIIKNISKMVEYIYKRCNKIFVSSPAFINSIKEKNIECNKIIFWPQYAEDFYQPATEKSNDIPNDEIINITFTGNIGTAQGLEILPETALILKNENLRVRFNIIGDGRNKDNLIKIIKGKQVDEYFNFVGLQPAVNIPKLLKSSDVAFLSFSDNLIYSMTIPAKLQSYMACAIPIIGSVSGESEKIIINAKCGFVCKVGDSEELAKTIKEFNKLSYDEKKILSDNANKYTKENFNKKILIDFIDQFFK